jgi:hypothetical protein
MDWRWILALATIAVGGIMWHIGGQGHKWVRSFALPIVLALVKFVMVLPNLLALLYAPLLMLAIILFSYGVKAPVHIIWVFIFGGKGASGDYLPVEICTRATCGIGWSLAVIPFALATGNWIGQIVYSAFLAVSCVVFGLMNNVTISETGTGASISCAVLI